MSVLKTVKRSFFLAAEATGLAAATRASGWRQRRLQILCYHGIALDDEHLWDPSFFQSRETFGARMQALAEGPWNVLPLDEALQRLQAGDLPPAAVAITFDDGMRDFAELAVPILQAHGLPATLYLTTYYCQKPLAVFPPMLAYLLWKGRARGSLRGAALDLPAPLPIRDPAERAAATVQLRALAAQRGYDADAEQALLAAVAEELGIDFPALCERGVLHLMTPAQVRALPDSVDVQLHTHRHRVPDDRSLFLSEIEDNRRLIREYRGEAGSLRHFCYPSGVHAEQFLPWLEEAGVVSATTCINAMASPAHHVLTLPRLIDTENLSALDFRAWLDGPAAWLPQRG